VDLEVAESAVKGDMPVWGEPLIWQEDDVMLDECRVQRREALIGEVLEVEPVDLGAEGAGNRADLDGEARAHLRRSVAPGH
jgi:hypothetical protein